MSETKSLWAYIALAIVCLLWGTTYFALRIGVETFPPFLFSAIRQVVAGGVLLLGLGLAGKLKVRRTDMLQQAIPGILMLALGNGIVGWCERYIPSGLAALILSLIPVFVVLINYASGLDRRRPHRLILTGLFLGCLGIVLIFRDNLADLGRPEYLSGMLVTFAACVIWAAGSVYAKHKTTGSSNVLQNAALQLFFGGLALLLLSVFLDDYSELQTVTAPSIWALVYLIVFGSIVGYSCFVYALKHLPIGVSSLYAYINPFIAILLGYFFLQEPLTGMTFLALAAALSGVYCINRGYREMEEK